MKHAPITQAGAATTELIATPGAGKHIVVWGYTLVHAAGDATFKSATTALSGAMPGAKALSVGGFKVFECATNEALNLVTTTGAAFGHVSYTIEAG